MRGARGQHVDLMVLRAPRPPNPPRVRLDRAQPVIPATLMTAEPQSAKAPACTHCGQIAVLVTGETIYPHRLDLRERYFWQCTPCDAWVGTHKGTQTSLGFPANKELRRARTMLHEKMVDPLWENAPYSGEYPDSPIDDARVLKKIRKAALKHVYHFLAHRLGIPRERTHIGMFTLEQCRAAWMALRGVPYREIRAWSKGRLRALDATRGASATGPAAPPQRDPALGPPRNGPCPCGSGAKYKRCCAPDAKARPAATPAADSGSGMENEEGPAVRGGVELGADAADEQSVT